MLLRIMLGAFFVVNASAKELPTPNHQPAKADLKDSVKDTTKNELSQLISLLLKTGKDGQIPENVAPDVGLPGSRPAKGVVIKDTSCVLVYEQSSDSANDGKRPLCILLSKHRQSGLDTEREFYNVNLDGQLERFLFQRGKVDEQGRPVQGSSIQSYPDINSSEVKKAFAAEMREVRAWLRQQMKVAAKTAAASAGKPADAARAAAAEGASASASPAQ